MKPCPWIVVYDATRAADAYALKCLRCGIVQRVATPISVSGWAALARVFEREHRGCPVSGGAEAQRH